MFPLKVLSRLIKWSTPQTFSEWEVVESGKIRFLAYYNYNYYILLYNNNLTMLEAQENQGENQILVHHVCVLPGI